MTDLLLETWVSGLIELNKFEWMLGSGHEWKPGTPLKLLFAGYNGTRNTGSDVRVEVCVVESVLMGVNDPRRFLRQDQRVNPL